MRAADVRQPPAGEPVARYEVPTTDTLIVGAGAAGLATAIFTARRAPGRSVLVVDGAKKPGAKILVSGGGRCNVTNRVVTERDFAGGSANVIKRVLAALPVERTRALFAELGVELYEEEFGKLFPVTDRARTVLDALLREADRLGVEVRPQCRVVALARSADGLAVETAAGDRLGARAVVLATGGQSYPKTGSDGSGYALARSVGHSLVPVTPALVPLLLAGEVHAELSGITQVVELILRAAGAPPVRLSGILLWTHFGISGPGVLDVSRHWHRAELEGREPRLSVNLLPGTDAAEVQARLLAIAAAQPSLQLRTAGARFVPARVAEVVLRELGIEPATTLAHLSKDVRRRFAHRLTDWALPVRGSRGFDRAEATAGGVPLREVDPATLESRCCPGLYLAGEILDVDGRIGGFNFQWAWSSAMVVARALARRPTQRSPW